MMRNCGARSLKWQSKNWIPSSSTRAAASLRTAPLSLNWPRNIGMPAIYPYRDYVEQGGLMALAPDLGELAERMANDVHQILNGVKPGDIPFYQPSKFQLIINMKAVK